MPGQDEWFKLEYAKKTKNVKDKRNGQYSYYLEVCQSKCQISLKTKQIYIYI